MSGDAISAYDSHARTYDEDWESSPITRDLRLRVRRLVVNRLPANGRILDVNCGTGTDALYFASAGYNVVAADGSREMLSIARSKMISSQLGQRIQFKLLENRDLASLRGSQFDVILSNFGGINTTDDLAGFAKDCRDLLNPNGYLVVNSLSRRCLWELVSGLVAGNLSLAFRRLGTQPKSARIGRGTTPVTYYSPRELRLVFAECFSTVETVGLGIIAPLPSSRRFQARHPFLSRVLSRMDERIGWIPLIKSLGDHFVVVASPRR